MTEILAATALAFVPLMLLGQGTDNLKAFPPAGEGMVRCVLQLPKEDDESSRRVELIVGQTVETDGQDRYFFAGKIDEETVKGWGFTLYKVEKLGPMAGTLIGVDPQAPRVSRFVTFGGEPYLIRYNSKLPVVIYVPKGVEVRYRIWRAGAEMVPITQG